MNKKELLREKAVDVFAQEGYHDTKVKMIAERAGVAVGTVYNYFSNKREILNYIFAVELDNKLEFLSKVKQKEISLKDKLIMFLNHQFEHLEENPNLATVLVQEIRMPRKHSLEAVENFLKQLPEIFVEMIDEAKERREIREVNSDLIANAIFQTIRSIAMMVVQNDEYNFSEAKRELINFFWLGIAK
ncbi:TetR/AcrR family transcriptional regulator [Halanaerobaculum tunisiense]